MYQIFATSARKDLNMKKDQNTRITIPHKAANNGGENLPPAARKDQNIRMIIPHKAANYHRTYLRMKMRK